MICSVNLLAVLARCYPIASCCSACGAPTTVAKTPIYAPLYATYAVSWNQTQHNHASCSINPAWVITFPHPTQVSYKPLKPIVAINPASNAVRDATLLAIKYSLGL